MTEIKAALRSLVPWWQPVLIGVLSVVFGVIVWIWPGETLYVFAILVGVWLITLGVSRLFSAFMYAPGTTTGQHVLSGVAGVLYLIGGAICLRHLIFSLAVIAAFVALQWLLTGIADIAYAMQHEGGQRVWMTIAGILSLLLGVVFLSLPGLSLSFFLVFTAVTALIVGIGQIVVGFRLRTMQS